MPRLTRFDGLGPGDVRAAWTALVAADPDATIFHSPRFQGVWADQLGRDLDLTTAVLQGGEADHDGDEYHHGGDESHHHGDEADHDGDGLLAVAVEAVGGDDDGTTWRFGGGTEVTDYTGPVSLPSARDEFLDTWLPAVLDVDVDRHVFGGLAVDTGWPDAIEKRLDALGLAATTAPVDVCPVLDISDGYDAYMDALPGKLRQEQKRKTRKLVRDVGDVSLDRVPAEDLEQGLDTFFAMQVDAESPKASFFDDERVRDFFRALAEEFAHDDVFRLHVLSVGDRPVAATVSLVDGRRWALYNSAFDPALSSFAPGIVLVAELVQDAAEEGLATFDLLRGAESYKYRFGAVDRDLVSLTVAG